MGNISLLLPRSIEGLTETFQVPTATELQKTLNVNAKGNKSTKSVAKIRQLQNLFTRVIITPGQHTQTPEKNIACLIGAAIGLPNKTIAESLTKTERSIEQRLAEIVSGLTGGRHIDKTLLGILAYIAGFVKLDDVLKAAGIKLPTVAPAGS